jgi:hypothetical protein
MALGVSLRPQDGTILTYEGSDMGKGDMDLFAIRKAQSVGNLGKAIQTRAF